VRLLSNTTAPDAEQHGGDSRREEPYQ